MPNSHSAGSATRTAGWAGRAGAGALAVAAAVAFGVVLGPVSAAHADIAVNSVADLALAFSTEASGSTITLTGDAVGDSTSPAVAVPAGITLTLDLNGHDLTLVGANQAAGLGVPVGATLTIIDSAPGGVVGTLNANGDTGGAGIGGDDGESSGTITINGGTISVTSVFAGAGIGGGWGGDGGTTTINGGTIMAKAGDMAAGIGGGHSGDGGTIAINGGIVTADSPTDGAAIGGGVMGAGASLSIGVGAEVTVSATRTLIGPGDFNLDFGSLTNAGTITIPFDNRFEIPDGFTATNSGTIRNYGVMTGDGLLVNSGTILNYNAILTPANVTGHNTTVVLDGNGGNAPVAPGVVYSDSFQNGQTAFPAAATRTGRTFTGWFTQAVGGVQVTGSTDLGLGGPKTVTLYAQWNETTIAGAGAPTLAATGSDLLPIGLIGSALVIAGLALYLRARQGAFN